MSKSYVQDVLLPVGKTVLAIGAPLAIGHLVYSMSCSYQSKTESEKDAFKRGVADLERAAALSLLPVLLVGGTIVYMSGGRT